jgi:RNA polymerase-interacting CarD/CdnL/TRCF family regulator
VESNSWKIDRAHDSAEIEIRMTLRVGAKIVYPGRGPCLIGPVVRKVVCGRSAKFYQLVLLDGTRAELFVPVDNLHDLHLRELLDRSEIPRLLDRLKSHGAVTGNVPPTKNWRERQTENSKLLSSGSIFDLADKVESLTQLSRTKTLATAERDTLYRARKLLVCEIAEVMNETKGAAEARIDRVLGASLHDVNH